MYLTLFRSFLLITLFLVLTDTLQAQKTSVRGTVLDSASNKSLEDATISLFHFPGPYLISSSPNRNKFAFLSLSAGKYLIVSSYQGYRPDSTFFSVGSKDTATRFFTIRLSRKENRLSEVIVQAIIPSATIRHDTITFNAIGFPTPPYSAVEELLRKLPGVEIDRFGNITVQRKRLDNITINGKDYFLHDIVSASQNLTADLVAKVEIFDTKSERAKRLGIKENGDGKTINLVLKKNLPVTYFGNCYAGIGNNDSYSTGGTATRIDSLKFIEFSGNANNINNQFTGGEHQNGAGMGAQSNSNLQLVYSNELLKHLSANLKAGRTYVNSTLEQGLSRQTALGDSSILQTSQSFIKNTETGYNVDANIDYQIDSFTRMNLHSTYSNQNNRNQTLDTVTIQTLETVGSYLSSIGKINNSLSESINTLSNKFYYSHDFQIPKKNISIDFEQKSSEQYQPMTLYSLIQNFSSLGDLLPNNTVNQQSAQKIRNNRYISNVSSFSPLGLHGVFEFKYRLNYSSEHSEKKSFNYNTLTGKYDLPDSLSSSRFSNHTNVQGLSVGYGIITTKSSFSVEMLAQLSQLENLNLINYQNLHQKTLDWIPTVSANWMLGSGKGMSFFYSGNTIAPTIEQLQPVQDLTNPYLIKVGNPNLKQQLTHHFVTDFSQFNTKSTTNWQVKLDADFSENQITNSSTLQAGGVQDVGHVNVQGVYHGLGTITFGFPFLGQKYGTGSVTVHGNLGHDISLVNGEQNLSQTVGIGGSAKINYHLKELLFVDVIADIAQTEAHYSLTGSPASQTLNENYSMNIIYLLPSAINLTNYYNLQVTGSQSNLPSRAFSLWNASISKSILKSQLEFRLSGFDLLNSSSSFSQNTGVNFVQTQKSNLRGRILLFSVVYRFK